MAQCVFTSSILAHPGLRRALMGVASHPCWVFCIGLERSIPAHLATTERDAPPGGRRLSSATDRAFRPFAWSHHISDIVLLTSWLQNRMR
jgi:hypothetical protein